MAESCLIYGDSGSTKTSQIVFLAKYIYETTGKITRMITADGGGYKPVEDSGLIEAGVIEILDFTDRMRYPFVLATLRRLARGQWPKVYVDPIDGKRKRGLREPESEDWKKVGAYAIDGIAGICDIVISNVSNRQEKALMENVRFDDDDETFGLSNMGHYGFTQKLVNELVLSFKALPVDMVLWTSLVTRGEDKKTKEAVYGPMIAGSAATVKAPGWFGSCLHLQVLLEEKKEADTGMVMCVPHPVAWFTKHPDEITGSTYLAKPRTAPAEFPRLMEKFSGGYITLEPESGIEKYFKLLDRLRMAGRASAEEWKKRVDEKRTPKNG